ncbi:MAG: hypothetical protein PHD32_01770 [Eubacteriales bacterium]|nr:hypothetical protein [Eubacteriales bacterium]
MEQAAKPRRIWPAFFAGLLCAALAYCVLCGVLGFDMLEHSPHDSYTLQAMRWRAGTAQLEENYSWLEIAEYEGKYYISFPPFPSVPMFLLTFVFGELTPSRLVVFAYFLLSYCAAFFLARRWKQTPWVSAALALFLVCGCNMMEFGLSGGVWNMAQVLGFLLTVLAFYGVSVPKRAGWYWGLIAIACAVGCRPMQAVYVPFLLLMVYQNLRKEMPGAGKTLLAMLPLLAAPLAIAFAYGLYNYVRFDDPFEFGHNYLPEFVQSSNGQFSLSYVGKNLRNIFRLPWWQEGRLVFPTDSGFAFWLCNPIYVFFAVRLVRSALKRDLHLSDVVLCVCLVGHFFALLLHKSFGGVQFGTRYLCDLAPALFFFLVSRREQKLAWYECLLMLWGVGFNLYGAYTFQTLVYG